nr:siderophore-interacting protein [Streptomonospora sp. PA3]
MRREFHPGTGVDRHLLIGDSSALPAIAAITESLPPHVPAAVYLAVGNGSDRDLLPRRGGVAVHWVEGASPSGSRSPLQRAVQDNETACGRTQVWLAAEAGVVRELRRLVLGGLGVARTDLHSAAYWKAGLDSTRLDDAGLRRYEREIAAGADPYDPATREAVELGL